MLSGMKAAINAFWRMIDLVMALLLAALIVLVFTNVVMRYGFSSGLRVTIELSRLWFVWVVMLGAAVMLFVGAWRQTLANWNNISQLTGLPSGLMYLAGVVSAAMMGAIALARIFGPDPGPAAHRVEEH